MGRVPLTLKLALSGLALVAGVCALTVLLPSHASAWSAPDGCGYSYEDTTYTWTELSTVTGTGINEPDDGSIATALPFTYKLCGTSYTQVEASSNGYVCLGTGSCSNLYPYAIPSTNNPAPFIAGYFTDLYPPGCTGGATMCTFASVQGAAPNRIYIYEMKGVPFCCSSGAGPVTFEIRLFETPPAAAPAPPPGYTQTCFEVDYNSVAGTGGFNPVLGGVQEDTVDGQAWDGPVSPGWTDSSHAILTCQTTTPPPRCSPNPVTVNAGTPITFSGVNGQAPLSWSAVGGSPNSQAAATPGSSFTTTYTYMGTYRATVTDAAGNSSSCVVNVLQPACGYTVDSNAPYNWTEIGSTAAGGRALAHSTSYWTSIAVTPSPAMNFDFCGRTYSTFWTSSQGEVCFGGSAATGATSPSPSYCSWVDWGYGPLPTTSIPGAAVFGYWSWMYADSTHCPSVAGGGNACTWYKVLGTTPNRVLVYEIKGMPEYYYSGSETFEFKFYESTNCIEVDYQSVSDARYGYGGYTNAGFQNAGGTSGWTYEHTSSSPGWSGASKAWRACPYTAAHTDALRINEDCAGGTCTTAALPGTTLLAPNTFDVLANDDQCPCTLTSVIGATHGTTGVSTSPPGITYTPNVDRNGIEHLAYRIHTSYGLNYTGLANLDVLPADDPPAFTGSAPVEAAEGGLPVVVPGWATGVVPGPATATDEAAQAVTSVVASDDNPGIFAVEPAVVRTSTATALTGSPTTGSFGALTFTPATGHSGVANVCVAPKDDGGTANGGVDTGTPQCTVITITPCEPQVDGVFYSYRGWDTNLPDANLGYPGILANDMGPPMTPVSVSTPPAHGTLTLSASGVALYRQDDNYTGPDGFDYQITCGHSLSGPVHVSLVDAVDTPPDPHFGVDGPSGADGSTFTFQGSVRDSDPGAGGIITSWVWDFGDGTQAVDLESPSHHFPGPGVYHVVLTVRDKVGAVGVYTMDITIQPADSDLVVMNGTAGADAPVAYAGENRTVPENTHVLLAGTQNGGDASVVFNWLQVRGTHVALENGTSRSPGLTTPKLLDDRPMDLTFRLVVSDEGRVSRPSYVTLHVVPNNHAPQANAGGTFRFAPGATATLDASGSTDADNDTLTYTWTQVQGPTVTLAGADTAHPTFTMPSAFDGLLAFQVRVSDGRLATQDIAFVEAGSVAPTPASPAPHGVPQAPVAQPQVQAAATSANLGWLLWVAIGAVALVAVLGTVWALRRKA